MLHYSDIEELAKEVCGLHEDADANEIDEALSDQFMLSFDAFELIAIALMKLTIPAETALTGKAYQGFVKDGAFICKIPCDA